MPIKIGFTMSLTGGSGANGQTAFLAQKLWEEDTNQHVLQLRELLRDDSDGAAPERGAHRKLLRRRVMSAAKT